MRYSKDYFQIQLDFAEKVSELTGETIEKVLFTHTAIPKAIGIKGWKFDEQDSMWKDFLDGLKKTDNKVHYIYSLCHTDPTPSGFREMFGCFWYEFDENDNHIKIHFRNNDEAEPGALSKEREGTRKEELSKMFKDIKQKYPKAETVTGFSWLYTIDSYTRLFPQEYIQNAVVSKGWFRSVALWGQFLSGDGEVKKEIAADFKACIRDKKNIDDLSECFYYKVLVPKTQIDNFYKFYQLENYL